MARLNPNLYRQKKSVASSRSEILIPQWSNGPDRSLATILSYPKSWVPQGALPVSVEGLEQTCLRRRCWGSMSWKSHEDGDREDGTPSSRSLFPPPSSPLLQLLRPAPECVLKHVDRLPPSGDVTRQRAICQVSEVTSSLPILPREKKVL